MESKEKKDKPPEKKADEIPAWKAKKNQRQQLLRAIRAKSFTESIRTSIRKEIKDSKKAG